MPSRRRFASLALSLPAALHSQSAPSYRSDLDHPRLLLPQRRARLIRREQERDSMRWAQFKTLIEGGAAMPEPGFAFALYYFASGNKERGRQAVSWALGPANDLRQLALVFDWCQFLMSDSEKERLASKIRTAVQAPLPPNATLNLRRNRVFAAIVLSGRTPDVTSRLIAEVVDAWWPNQIVPKLKSGDLSFGPQDHHPLYEMFHALRDNFDIDLRESAPKYFAAVPAYHLMAHYPAPYPGPENEYRIPIMPRHGEPDLRTATLSRAAALSMVAFDTNAQESQFLQGWLMIDRFLLRGPFGIPYEYLWANPYQPGLSFHYLPNIFHDPASGRLLVRSSWEDDAVWFYQASGIRQMFRDGQVLNLDKSALDSPVQMGAVTLMSLPASGRFSISSEDQKASYYLFGLTPSAAYDIEVDDEDLREGTADRGGVLELSFPPKRKAGVLVRKAKTT
jgi:hypothetical protein